MCRQSLYGPFVWISINSKGGSHPSICLSRRSGFLALVYISDRGAFPHLYGACLSDSNAHDHENLPTLLVGGTADQFKGNCHVRYPKHTPMTNLFLTMLDKVGVRIDTFGNSSGLLNPLTV